MEQEVVSLHAIGRCLRSIGLSQTDRLLWSVDLVAAVGPAAAAAPAAAAIAPAAPVVAPAPSPAPPPPPVVAKPVVAKPGKHTSNLSLLVIDRPSLIDYHL